MRRVVIKLGTAIVADDRGEPRADVLARVCDAAAGLRAAGDEVVLVTSGAIARGMREMGLVARPNAIEELQAASAIGQGKLYRVYDELLLQRGIVSAQVLLTFFDVSARTHYLNVRRTLRQLLDWGIVPVVNENDTTTTDEISFGDNDFLSAQVGILIGADQLIILTDADQPDEVDPRVRRDAVEGRRRGYGDGGRNRHDDLQRPPAWCARARPRRRSGGHPVRRAGDSVLELQALAQVREAEPRDGLRRRRGCPGADPRRHEPPAGRGHRRQRGLRVRRRGRGRPG
jgi:hypothetical protein